ncbi:hypothetical protein KCU73_g5694, partial [Aureobasidium melanogenum]
METNQLSEHNANSDHATLNLAAATESTESSSIIRRFRDLEKDLNNLESSKVSLCSKIPLLQVELARLLAKIISPEASNEATDGTQPACHSISLHEHERQIRRLEDRLKKELAEKAVRKTKLEAVQVAFAQVVREAETLEKQFSDLLKILET